MPKDPEEVALDFSGVRPFEPMNAARNYLCKATNLTIGKAKASGLPKTSLELTILAPEMTEVVDINGEVQEDPKTGDTKMTRAAGRKLFREFSLQPDALPFLYEFIKAVAPDTELGEDFRYKPANYMGLDCAVKINNEEFEEQIRPRVRRILPASAYTE